MGSIFSQNFIRERSFHDIKLGGCTLGYAFDLFLPDSRGSHLSALHKFTVLENGVAVPSEQMVLELHGKEFPVSHFPTLGHEYWRIDEDARLKILNGKSYREVDSVAIDLVLRVSFVGTWEEPVLAPMHAFACPGKEGR